MRVCIDLDDYHTSSRWECSDVIERIIELFPRVKLTLFVTPFMKRIPLTENKHAVKKVITFIEKGWIEVFLHGFTHKKFIKGEFYYLPAFLIKRKIEKAEMMLIDAGIAFSKGIKFPWDIYGEKELGIIYEKKYTLFTHKLRKRYAGVKVVWGNYGNVVKAYIQTSRYRYGRLNGLNENAIVYYHGHAQNMRDNGIRESFDNFVEELKYLVNNFNVDFIFTSEIPKYVEL